MISLHEPSWSNVRLGLAVGAVGVVGLVFLRWKARWRTGLSLRQNKSKLTQWTPADDELPDEERPVTKTMKAGLAVLTVLAIVIMLSGFNFGIKNYRLMKKLEDAQNLISHRDYAAAILVFRAALKVDPGSVSLRFHLADLLSTVHRYAEAIPEYTQALVKEPNNGQGHLNLAIAMDASGRHIEAMKEFLTAARILPNDPHVHFSLATALLKSNQLEAASSEYRRVVYLSPNNLSAHLNLCSLLVALHKKDESLIEGRKAIEMAPNSVLAHSVLGYAYGALGLNKDAVTECKRVTELAPNLPAGYFNLGRAQVRTDWKAALHSLEKFLQMTEGRPEYEPDRSAVKKEIAKLLITNGRR